MTRCGSKSIVGVLLLCLCPVLAAAQGRTAGQVVGTVKDASGGVVPGAAVILIQTATGLTVETKSGPDGNFTFPNLQAGRYQITATMTGFQPVTIQEVNVETARSIDLVVQFKVAGVTEEINVVGRSQVVETTSTTVASTVSNAEIARLPMAGRNILNFALLVPGAATSAGGRDSEYNGLPGGAINITLDGVNNNSARFRSGGTSFFVFAPIRLGAIEEVTVSTAGLTADAGAEGAVQVQFVTRRGTNNFHGSVFDQYSSDKLNANGFVNRALGRPKTKLRRHEWGANYGGPIVHGKLFFFANYEQIYQPSETTIDRNVLPAEAQQGIFRYTALDNSIQTVNLLAIAQQNGLPSAIDPYVARQFQAMNDAMALGTVTPTTNLRQDTLRFVNDQLPNANIYPTGRVDYQVNPKLAIRGVMNLHWRDLPTNPQYPGLPRWNGGFTSTYYILSTGADWSVGPNLFYQMSFGGQSNFEEFNPGNTLDLYAPQGGYRVILPLMTSPEPTNDVMPIPRNNPVWNFTNSFTWVKGRHNFTFGGTFRRTTMYESIGGAPPTITLGVGTGDPASSAFTATTIPGVRAADLPTALQLYALLTGRISTAGGTYFLDENTQQYRLGPAFRREAQNVGGIYAQDQWRVNPSLTLNYGLRWEFSGAATNPNSVYSGPGLPDLLGPSTAPFQPGVLDGVANPQVLLRPSPYKSDWVNPAPNVGVAWNPAKADGLLGTILGNATYRGNFGVNYYDEGLINFQSAAGNGPGLSQTLALPPFTPGSLNLQTPLPPFTATPTAFVFPIPMSGFTFNRGFRSIDPDIRTPYVNNWTVGYQRELPANSALEIRYVGNHGSNLWRTYNLNETNIIENRFIDDFRNAQQNLAINLANGRTGFANQGLPGQVALPIFETAFGARGSVPALPAASGFTNGTFVTQLQQGQAGRLANTLAGDFRYLCAMVGNTLPGCASRNYDAPGPYPINVFQANPFAAGSEARVMTDEASSKYHALQIQFRKRYARGVSMTAHYTFGKAQTDRYVVGADGITDYRTLRDKALDWGPTAYDLRHNFQTYWTYDLPFGDGRHYAIDNRTLNHIAGGWTASGVVRIQSGRPFLLTSGRQTLNQQDAGVVLNGISLGELQSMVNVRPGPDGGVYFFDERLIGTDGRANPALLAPPTTPGQQGQYVFLYGPGLWTADLGIAKMFAVKGATRINFEVLLINAFDHRNNTVGGTGGASHSIDSITFGQTTGTAIGAREIQIRFGVSF